MRIHLLSANPYVYSVEEECCSIQRYVSRITKSYFGRSLLVQSPAGDSRGLWRQQPVFQHSRPGAKLRAHGVWPVINTNTDNLITVFDINCGDIRKQHQHSHHQPSQRQYKLQRRNNPDARQRVQLLANAFLHCQRRWFEPGSGSRDWCWCSGGCPGRCRGRVCMVLAKKETQWGWRRR